MIKKSFILLGLSTLLYSQNNSYYTYVFSNVANIENANAFISKNLRNYDNVQIVKYKDRYRVVYGKFFSKKDALQFKAKLSNNLKNLEPFLVQYSNNQVIYKQNNKNLNKIQNNSTNQVIKRSDIEKNDNLTGNQNNNFSLGASNEEITNYIDAIDSNFKSKKQEIIKHDYKNNSKLGIDLEYSRNKTKNNFTYGSNQKINSEDLDLDNLSNSYIPSLYYKNGNHKYQASFMKNNSRGNVKAKKDLQFDNYTYSLGDVLNTNSDTNWFTGGYKYTYKDLSVGADIHNYKNRLEINSSNNKTFINNDFIFPSIGIDIKHKINDFSVLYGGDYGTLGSTLKYYKYYLGVGVNDIFLDNINFNIGYKNKTIDIRDNIYDGKTEYSGAYVEVNKEF